MNLRMPTGLGLALTVACASLVGAQADDEVAKAKSAAKQVDHLIYFVPDLDEAIDTLEAQLGVRAVFSGQHPGRGSHNALLSLGQTAYLEIIALDPTQTEEARGGSFVAGSEPYTMVGWAARSDDLEALASAAGERGVEFSEIDPGGRAMPDGTMLQWRTAGPENVDGGGLVPFFIDWGESPHPATTSPGGLRLIELRAEHPEPESVRTILDALDLDLPVSQGAEPALIATIEGPNGGVELR